MPKQMNDDYFKFFFSEQLNIHFLYFIDRLALANEPKKPK